VLLLDNSLNNNHYIIDKNDLESSYQLYYDARKEIDKENFGDLFINTEKKREIEKQNRILYNEIDIKKLRLSSLKKDINKLQKNKKRNSNKIKSLN